jgi:hypothetical protein
MQDQCLGQNILSGLPLNEIVYLNRHTILFYIIFSLCVLTYKRNGRSECQAPINNAPGQLDIYQDTFIVL